MLLLKMERIDQEYKIVGIQGSFNLGGRRIEARNVKNDPLLLKILTDLAEEIGKQKATYVDEEEWHEAYIPRAQAGQPTQPKKQGIQRLDMGLANGQLSQLNVTTHRGTHAVTGPALQQLNQSSGQKINLAFDGLAKSAAASTPEIKIEKDDREVIKNAIRDLPLKDAKPTDAKSKALLALLDVIELSSRGKKDKKEEIAEEAEKTHEREKKAMRKEAIKQDLLKDQITGEQIDESYQQLMNLSADLGWKEVDGRHESPEARTQRYREFLMQVLHL